MMDSRLTHDEFNTDFLNLMAEKQTLAKVIDLAPLGELVGPGASGPDLGHSHFKVWSMVQN